MPPTPGARGLWKPLRLPVFRELLVADVVSDIHRWEIFRDIENPNLYVETELLRWLRASREYAT